MDSYRLLLFAAIVLASALPGTSVAGSSSARDFDFLVGDWHAHHRRLLPDGSKWVEFDGTLTLRKVLDGSVNVEEHLLPAPTGTYRAVGLRAFDPKTRDWSIWWLDGRYPSMLGKPVVGHFEHGVGRFYSRYEQDGKPMIGRYLWSNITPTSARWEQASSADGGKTWQSNWMFTLTRDTKKPPEAAARADAHDFDFLVGGWRVHHRYLTPTGEWKEIEGSVTDRPLMGGSGNLEEHTFNGAKAPTYGLAVRSYDAAKSQWSIWWLDARDPSHDLDPPTQGHWENGVGTFFGTATLDNKTLPARLIWSHITPSSAHWEQAYSFDDGKTWQTNWIMEFQRSGS